MTTQGTSCISCFNGLAPIRVPDRWLVGFDMERSFALVGDQARINFGAHGAFGVTCRCEGASVSRLVVRLSEADVAATPWGAFAKPWERWQTAIVFGHGPITDLREV